MRALHQYTRGGESQKAADSGQNACTPPQTNQRENEVRRKDGRQLARLKRNQARKQNSPGDGNQRREKRIRQATECLQDPNFLEKPDVRGRTPVPSGPAAALLHAAVFLRGRDNLVRYGMWIVDVRYRQPACLPGSLNGNVAHAQHALAERLVHAHILHL